MKTTVIYHSADFDGLFCREIAKKFLPEAELIGWDFGDSPVSVPAEGTIFVMDLPVDRIFGMTFGGEGHLPWLERVIWIDHHKSSIETHNRTIPGYRIDGVAACRLAWQWFEHTPNWCAGTMKDAYVARNVPEPLAVRLAGEYDIWDKRDPRAELFQHGLRSQELTELTWRLLLIDDGSADGVVESLLHQGKVLQYARDQEYKEVIQQQGFDLLFEGLNFLACNSHELDIRSQLFIEGIRDHHDALLGFTWTGSQWRVSLYHITNHEHHDLSEIAKKYGGGGHKGACGFVCATLPFPLDKWP